MTRPLRAIATLASALAIPLMPHADGRQIPLRVTTYGVRLDVLVMNGGRPVSGLRPDDFEVLDANVPQHVDTATAVSHVAMAIVLDTSVSAHHAGFAGFARASDVLIRSLGPNDLAALVTFADHVTLAVPLTGDLGLLRRATVAPARLGDGSVPRSTTWDAVFGAAGLVARDPGRPLVVLVSDGVDNASWLSGAQVARRLADAGIVVDFVKSSGFVSPAYPDGPPPGSARPEDVPKATGGEIYSLTDTRLAQRFAAHLNDLRQAYVLTYEPRDVKTDDGWHDVKVRVRGRNAIVKARPGYYANRAVR